MKWLKTLMICLLALVWAVASHHCKLEQLPGFSFLACCQHEEAPPHQDNDCKTDVCAVVENQLYKTENAPLLVKPTTQLPHFLLTSLAIPAASQASAILPDAVPRELARAWQFSHRTAPQPRAPSLLS